MTISMVSERMKIPNSWRDFVKLEYRIAGSSGHSANYRPENITSNDPLDQGSRWSSLANDQNQFLMLQLDRPALVRSVTFGKFFKTHVCNLKEFKVMAGSDPSKLHQVLHSGLRNDSKAETFPLKFEEEMFAYSPIQWIKIVPMAAWGNNFNFSIWHVELRGIADIGLVREAHRIYAGWEREEAWRRVCKFLRGEERVAGMIPAIEAAAGIEGEAPLVRSLYQLLVEAGDFCGAESLLGEALKSDPKLFDDFIQEHVPYHATWEQISPDNGSGNNLAYPSRRGGHQMVWDPVGKRVYLFGGWDGSQDLSDFWMYDTVNNSWTCLSPDTRLDDGPGPRSCHKMCIHAGKRLLYVFGRFVEQDSRTGASNTNLSAELFQYDLESHVWSLVSGDVEADGGPGLLYDHQMVVDEAEGLIYVFGGRIISSNVGAGEEAQYSGLYVYDIEGGGWKCLRPDSSTNLHLETPSLRSRIGHSMLHDPTRSRLLILAGQRNKDYLADMLVYDIQGDTVVEMERDTGMVGGPEAGFTQRATADWERGEVYLLTGLMRESTTAEKKAEGLGRNSFWVYSLSQKSWKKAESLDEATWPHPRFAHQLCYDPATHTHYLFGGNPGDPTQPKRRLNDFWRMSLRPACASADVGRRTRFLVRRGRFYEMCVSENGGGQVEALRYLQEEVAAVVDHQNAVESEEFRSLSTWLFQPKTSTPMSLFAGGSSPVIGIGSYLAGPEEQIRLARSQLFDQIASLLPRTIRPPPSFN